MNQAIAHFQRHPGAGMKAAAHTVLPGDIPLYQALRRRLQQLASPPSPNKLPGRSGAPQTLPVSVEDALIRWIDSLVARRLPPTKIQICMKAKKLGAAIGVHFRRADGMPGDDWWSGFKQRHPTLRGKKANALDGGRAGVTQLQVAAWAATYSTQLSIVRDAFAASSRSAAAAAASDSFTAARVWNADELGVGDHIKGRSSDDSNNPNCERIQPSSKGHITIMVCVNADGHTLPPFCIKAGATVRAVWSIDCPRGTTWIAGGQGSSSMTQDIFFDWMIHFISSMPADYFVAPRSASLPSLLLLDNHSSRLNQDALLLARDHNIAILGLLANSTHFLQPCDQHINSRFKAGWRNAVADGQLAVLDEGQPPPTLGSLITAGYTQITPDTVRASRRDTFLWPLDMQQLEGHRRAAPVRSMSAPLPQPAATAGAAAAEVVAVASPPPAKKARKQHQPRSTGRVLTAAAFLGEMSAYSASQQTARQKKAASLLKQLTQVTAQLAPSARAAAVTGAAAAAAGGESDKENVPPVSASGRPARVRKRAAQSDDYEYKCDDSD